MERKRNPGPSRTNQFSLDYASLHPAYAFPHAFGIAPIYDELGRISRPVRCCSRACAVQPAARATAKIGVKACLGIASASSRIAVKNSTLVSGGRSGFFLRSALRM